MKEKYFSVNEAGCSIRCKLYFNDLKNIRRAVLCGHGFGGHKDNMAGHRFAEHLLKKHKDMAAVTFDLPCHGDDAKSKLNLADCDLYIREMNRYVTEHFSPEGCYYYATSFGGYLVLRYIALHGDPFRKIALRCPAVDMYTSITTRIIQSDEAALLEKNKPVPVGFDRKIRITSQFLEELKAENIDSLDYHGFADDIFIVHGTKDEIVSFDFVRSFADRNDILFFPVDNADHRFKDPRKMDEAINMILEFFEL